MPQMNATAVIPLNDTSIDFFKKIQLNHPIPKGAKYIAFLEDGDACFLESLEGVGFMTGHAPKFAMLTYYENIPVEFED